MWLGEKNVRSRAERRADVGLVTIGGDSAGVYTNLEKRQVSAYAPGGYFWLPKEGQRMLLVRAADGENCIAGAEQTGCPQTLEAGEVYIMSGENAAHICLKNDGSMEIRGRVLLRGNVGISGNISVLGTVNITGGLIVNGNSVN